MQNVVAEVKRALDGAQSWVRQETPPMVMWTTTNDGWAFLVVIMGDVMDGTAAKNGVVVRLHPDWHETIRAQLPRVVLVS